MARPKSATKPEEKPVKPGRPPGAENRKYDIVDATPTKCRCGSTARSEYQKDPKVHRQPCSDGVTVTTWRRCQCLACGQWRKDRFQHTETI